MGNPQLRRLVSIQLRLRALAVSDAACRAPRRQHGTWLVREERVGWRDPGLLRHTRDTKTRGKQHDKLGRGERQALCRWSRQSGRWSAQTVRIHIRS